MTDYDPDLDGPRTRGYGERKITETFDDLAEGIYVTIKNPALMPEEALRPRRDLSKIKDRKEIAKATNAWLGTFILDWNVYDAEDFSDDPAVLGDPCAETVAKCPAAITSWIARKIMEVSDPR
jgi:hypothetical protein